MEAAGYGLIMAHLLISACRGLITDCVPELKIHANKHVTLGVNQPNINDLSPCILACLFNSHCQTLYFDGASMAGYRCWLNHIKINETQMFSGQGIDTYTVQTSCQEIPKDNGCWIAWVKYSASNANGGTAFGNVPDAEHCKSKCLQREDCVAVDYHPGKDSNCWLHMSPDVAVNIKYNQDITHYNLRRICTDTGAWPGILYIPTSSIQSALPTHPTTKSSVVGEAGESSSEVSTTALLIGIPSGIGCLLLLVLGIVAIIFCGRMLRKPPPGGQDQVPTMQHESFHLPGGPHCNDYILEASKDSL